MATVDRNANAELHARFDDVFAQYTKVRQGVSSLQRDLAALEATVKTPDGMVTVVVGPRGNLKQISLHERAYQTHSPARLAELITQAVQRGETIVSGAVKERMSELLPPGSDVDSILQRHDERMGYRDEQ